MFRKLALLIAVVSCPLAAHAAGTDALIEGAKQCTRQLPRYEREYGIPQHLLTAIAATESGRWHSGLNISLPWPWTINAEGKGYYFNSKQEAIVAARKFQSRGVKSIDVGCMQVNLMHHPNAFSSLEEAFEPQNNVAYAASFLRNLYQDERTWKAAAAAYHSKTPSRGSEYVGLVMNRWYNIVDRIRRARGGASEEPKVAQVKPQLEQKPVQVASVTPLLSQTPPHKELGEQKVQKAQAKPAYKPVSMRSIEVKNTKREAGVLVIRPQVEQPVTLASADTKVLQVTPAVARSTATVQKSGPRFIFND